MLDNHLRFAKERLAIPMARLIGGSLHPTAITLIAAGVGLGAATAAGVGAYTVALPLWLLNRTIDGLDGTVARLTGTQSDLGGYLDLLLDVVVYSAIPIAVALDRADSTLFVIVALLLALFYVNITSWLYLSALIEKRASSPRDRAALTSIVMPTGVVEGSETILFYSLVLLLPRQAELLLAIMSAAVIVGIAQRVRWALRNLRT